MPSTLKDAISSIKLLSAPAKRKEIREKISEGLIGKYEGIIPAGKTSTEEVKELRRSLYGKIKG